MSKYTLVKELQKEIATLNDVIDLRIIKGLSYKAESKRHKFLMKQLSSLNRGPVASQSWMTRMGQFVGTFMF